MFCRSLLVLFLLSFSLFVPKHSDQIVDLELFHVAPETLRERVSC